MEKTKKTQAELEKTLERIASLLCNIYVSDFSTAEKDIAKLLEQNGYLRLTPAADLTDTTYTMRD